MTAANHLGVSRRLPIIASVILAYRNVLMRPGRLFTLAVLPAVVCLTLGGILVVAPWRIHPLSPLFLLLLLFPMSYLGLAWTRCSIFDQQPRLILRRPWITAYLRALACYSLWTLCLVIWPAPVILIAVFVAYGLVGGGDAFSNLVSFLPVSWLCLVVVGVIPFARLFLSLPLIATNQPALPLAAWRLGSNIGFQLRSALFLLAVTFLAVILLCLGLLIAAAEWALYPALLDPAFHDTVYVRYGLALPISFGIVVPIGSVIGTTLFAELLAIAFREADSWSGFRESIFERFD